MKTLGGFSLASCPFIAILFKIEQNTAHFEQIVVEIESEEIVVENEPQTQFCYVCMTDQILYDTCGDVNHRICEVCMNGLVNDQCPKDTNNKD